MSQRYFGTDGIRGKVGTYPMTPEFVLKLGWAAGKVLGQNGKKKVLIGKDTRISGYMFESVLESGLSAAGVNVLLLGPMPTPAVAYLTRAFRASAGIVISASHNPYEDNGVKFFSHEGMKLSDEIELAIEEMLDKPMDIVPSQAIGKVERIIDARGRYIEFCKRNFPLTSSLHGLKIVVDCAHGATYAIAPELFRELGAKVIEIGTNPNGININENCGATDTKALQQKVIAENAHLGIALDGDGDRLIMVDNQGQVVDGDEILYIIAKAHQASTGLAGVVGTLMSNLGLEHALAALNIPFQRAKVGDRYVMEKLLEAGWEVGGETSGHIICLNNTSTGDGLVAALQVLGYMVETGHSLAELKKGMHKYPQILLNVETPKRIKIEEIPNIDKITQQAEETLGNKGRILLRASGTQNLIRVMVEGQEQNQVELLANNLAEQVEKSLININ